MELDDEDELIHREPGFVIEKSANGCTLFVEEITARYPVAEFKNKLSAMSYKRQEFDMP